MPLPAFPWAYAALVAVVGGERVAELVLSRRNLRRAEARGGREVASGHFPAMAALHTGLLLAAVLETWLLERPWIPALGISMLVVVALAMALRYWAIATLGERWNTRIVVWPGAAPIVGGPYRLVRHPNYAAVAIEVAALPLIHTAWLTAGLASVLNAWVLTIRVRAEETALAATGDYARAFADRPRFLPLGGPRGSR